MVDSQDQKTRYYFHFRRPMKKLEARLARKKQSNSGSSSRIGGIPLAEIKQILIGER